MPVDPVVLLKYEQRPRPPRRGPRDGLIAIGLVVAGVAAAGALTAWGRQSAAGAAVLVRITIVAWLLSFLALARIGWREDGPIGVLYRLKHPLGSVLAESIGGARQTSWMAIAIAIVLIALSVGSGLALAVHPDAFPAELLAPRGGTVMRREVRDELLR